MIFKDLRLMSGRFVLYICLFQYIQRLLEFVILILVFCAFFSFLSNHVSYKLSSRFKLVNVLWLSLLYTCGQPRI